MKEVAIESAVKNFTEKLNKKLKEENVGSRRMGEYDDAVKYAAILCEKQFSGEFGRFAGQFTSHGTDHAARVLSYALLLTERLTPGLNATELFVLGIACILHDIGMTGTLPTELDILNMSEDQRWSERRKRHGEAGAEMIRKRELMELQVVSKPEEDIYYTFLPHICAAHCSSGFEKHIDEIRKLKAQHHNNNRFEILAGILLLADEMDVSCLRARPDIERYNEFRTTVTKAHWWKHWLVAEVSLDGNIIYVSCLSGMEFHWADEFALWTISKLKYQIACLRNKLPDFHGSNQFWDIEVKIIPIFEVWWRPNLPEITVHIVEEAQKNRLSIPGEKMDRIIEPEKLIERIINSDAIQESSVFFREIIAPRISHFRGHGQFSPLELARMLYVEEDSNMVLLRRLIDEWRLFVEEKKNGVNLKMFVGDIGVGKTHFLSAFLFEISTSCAENYNKTIIVRAELTQCDRSNLLSVKRQMAFGLFDDLHLRLGIAIEIREIMLKYYEKDISPQIPLLKEEIGSWDTEKIDQFFNVVGMICHESSLIHRELGPRAPQSMCIFCDNSDQLNQEIIGDLYGWANNISGSANCLVWLFLRPDSLAYLKNLYQSAHFGLRIPEPIVAPLLKEIIYKRIETFLTKFKKNEKISVPFGPGTISPTDAQSAILYIVRLTLETSDPILPKLTERTDGIGQSNIRAALQTLINILGSHIISDEEYGKALMLQVAKNEGTIDTKLPKSIFERWSKILEATILGQRIWYSPLCGPVENLFGPPEVEGYGDYFIMIHCLQMLFKNKGNEYHFFQLNSDLQKIGYQPGRVLTILKHLATRDKMLYEPALNDDPFLKKAFPLVEINLTSPNHPIRDNTLIQITPWGEFHLTTFLVQAQYWRHIFYQIVFPASIARNMNIECARRHVSELMNQLSKVFNFLNDIEKSWFYGFSIEELNHLGLSPVIEKIKLKVCHQLGQ